jgi:hypothetical protein
LVQTSSFNKALPFSQELWRTQLRSLSTLPARFSFPPVTVMGRFLGLVSLVPPSRRPPPEGDCRRVSDPAETRCLSPISATNLLSTSTPEAHQLSARRLSPPSPSRPNPPAPQHACAEFLTTPSEEAPSSPKASSDLSDATIGAVASAAVCHRSHPAGPLPFVSGGVNRHPGIVSRCADRTT